MCTLILSDMTSKFEWSPRFLTTDVNMAVHTEFTTCLQTRFQNSSLVNAMRPKGKIGLNISSCVGITLLKLHVRPRSYTASFEDPILSSTGAVPVSQVCLSSYCTTQRVKINRLKTMRRLFFLKIHSVPRCKHFSSRL
jgi:hypothetical protein